MNCPYCKKNIYAFTGFQEAEKFQKHLSKCRKNPNKKLSFQLTEALEIRANSDQ